MKRYIPAAILTIAIFSSAALYTSCKRGGDNPPPDIPPTTTTSQQSSAPTLSQIQSDIFTPSCATAGCHNSSAAGGLRLDAGNSFGNLVNVTSAEAGSLKRVNPGSSSSSYIINKMENTQGSVGGSGTVMPPGGARPSSEIQKVKDWINAGASNN